MTHFPFLWGCLIWTFHNGGVVAQAASDAVLLTPSISVQGSSPRVSLCPFFITPVMTQATIDWLLTL